jgi:D-alanyl-D-alanine carboxypeptidase/D-alanyl-D-alanine-endopeptidase (penicillin-binding protein 4)
MLRRFFILLLIALNTAAFSPILAQNPQLPGAPAAPSASPQPAPRTSIRISVGRSVTTAPNNLAELQTRIKEIARQPALEPGFFAVKIVSLDTGLVIYEQSANKFTRPASNMKLYTVAAALDRLTPDYHFMTSVYAKEKPEDGKIKGDLIVYGRGDPSFAARFNNGDYFKGIDDLAGRIVAGGVKRIKGDLVGDESWFNGAPLGSGWEWDDLQWSYGAPVSALTINDNAIDLTVKPGERVGAPVVITSGPPATFMTIANRATTGPRGSKSDLNIYRGLGANAIEISGRLPLGDNGFTGGVAIPDPALAFVTMLREALVKRGVKIDGRVRTVDARSAASIVPNPLAAVSPGSQTPTPPAEIAGI